MSEIYVRYDNINIDVIKNENRVFFSLLSSRTYQHPSWYKCNRNILCIVFDEIVIRNVIIGRFHPFTGHAGP